MNFCLYYKSQRIEGAFLFLITTETVRMVAAARNSSIVNAGNSGTECVGLVDGDDVCVGV